MNQRGFVLVEFVIALPLLLMLLYALVTLTFKTAKMAREQVADYTLETEAQETIERIAKDARAAYRVEITNSKIQDSKLENIIFVCHANHQKTSDYFQDIWTQRIYAVDSASSNFVNKIYKNIYFKRTDDNNFNNPITGKNDFGNTDVLQLNYSENFLSNKILHITLEIQSDVTNKKIKFNTAIYMPNCKKIIYKGTTILDE